MLAAVLPRLSSRRAVGRPTLVWPHDAAALGDHALASAGAQPSYRLVSWPALAPLVVAPAAAVPTAVAPATPRLQPPAVEDELDGLALERLMALATDDDADADDDLLELRGSALLRWVPIGAAAASAAEPAVGSARTILGSPDGSAWRALGAGRAQSPQLAPMLGLPGAPDSPWSRMPTTSMPWAAAAHGAPPAAPSPYADWQFAPADGASRAGSPPPTDSDAHHPTACIGNMRRERRAGYFARVSIEADSSRGCAACGMRPEMEWDDVCCSRCGRWAPARRRRDALDARRADRVDGRRARGGGGVRRRRRRRRACAPARARAPRGRARAWRGRGARTFVQS
jgi:hypothetical protein